MTGPSTKECSAQLWIWLPTYQTFLISRGLSIWREEWDIRQHRMVGSLLKLVLHSLGCGESSKTTDHDRSYGQI